MQTSVGRLNQLRLVTEIQDPAGTKFQPEEIVSWPQPEDGVRHYTPASIGSADKRN